MKINLTRRDVLKFGAGAAVGVMLTPAPWKAVDDLAIWTQNWKWIPVPPKGPVSWKQTNCSLCPAGCAVKARCIGALPVSMHANENFGGTSICALGMTGHHLAWHPARADRPAHVLRRAGSERRVPVTIEAVLAEVAAAARDAKGSVAVIDARPGRSMSEAWRVALAPLAGAAYIPAPNREGVALTSLAAMSGLEADAMGVDLAGARTILSFGAPLAEGWGSAETRRRVLRGDDSVRLIQVDATQTPTARAASRWLPARPGTEGVLALGIANVLLTGKLVDAARLATIPDFTGYATLVERFTPAAVAQTTGVPATEIVAAARELVAEGPVVVIAGENGGTGRFGRNVEAAILGLNVLIGALGRDGGILARQTAPSPFEKAPAIASSELSDLADRSVALLIIDATEGDVVVPWQAIERKLVPGASRVVALSPFVTGIARHADYVVPTAAFLESIHEAPAAIDSRTAGVAFSAVLLPPRKQIVDPIVVARALGAAADVLPATSEELVRARVTRIAAAGKGCVTQPDGTPKSVSDYASADELWEAMVAGGRWNSDVIDVQKTGKVSLLLDGSVASLDLRGELAPDPARRLLLIASGPRDATASSAVSPVMTKIYQESGLRRSPGIATVNPRTAGELGARDGATVMLETASGAALFRLETGQHVMPGVVEVAIGPDATALGIRKKARDGGQLDLLPASPASRTAAIRVVEG